MAYTDYKTQTQLRGSVTTISPNSPDGAPAQWIHNGESAQQTITNRPVDALALNMDNLKIPLDADKAIGEVGALTTFSGSSITINPDATGGAHIDFAVAGTLYVGNSAKYTAPAQELIDNLFQFLDEDYNEVMVDGAEVKVTAVANPPGADFGNGFFSGAVVTLTLSDTVPSGNYRLKYSKGTTIATLPDDALITSDIRGLQEGSAENQKPMWAVCAPAGGRGDYAGADAFEEAVANGEKRIYLKAGTYGPLTADTALTAIEYIMGEGVDAVTIQISGNYNMTDMPSGHGFTVEVTSAAANNNHVTLADGAVVRSVKFKSLRLHMNSNVVVDNILCGGFWGGFIVPANTYNVKGSNISYDASDFSSSQFFKIEEACRNLEFSNIRPLVIGSNLASIGEPLLYFEGTTASSGVKFTNCYFETSSSYALQTGNDVEYATFENCVFENNDTVNATVFISGASEVAFIGCRIEQLATTSSSPNTAIRVESASNLTMKSCNIVSNAVRQAARFSSVSFSIFESCWFETTSEDYSTVELTGAMSYITIQSCRFEQASTTSTGTNPAFFVANTLTKSKISGCYFLSSSNYAFKTTATMDEVSIDGCEFRGGSTVFDMEGTDDNNVSIRNCYIRNINNTWYNERFVRILSYASDEYIGGLNRVSPGVILDNVYMEDEWCQGHDSTTAPTGGTSGGTGGFPVVELLGVSGTNVTLDREDVDYNVENGSWLSMENCRIERVFVHVDNNAPMTPHTYAAGTVSNGIIEVKGPSAIRGLRFGDRLVDAVSRSVIWVQSASNMDATDDWASSRQAVIDDVQVNFDDGTATFDSPNEEGIALTLAGNARVSGFVWNGDCKVDEREVVGLVAKTASIVRLMGDYNKLENSYIRHDCSTQGSVQDLIVCGEVGDYGNKIVNCTIKTKLHIPADDGNTEFPSRVIDLLSGTGSLVSGCEMFAEGSPQTGSFFAFILATGANNYRVVGNSMVIDGDLDSHANSYIINAVDSVLINPSASVVGNTLVVRQGTTAPNIDASTDSGNDKLLDTTSTNYPSL